MSDTPARAWNYGNVGIDPNDRSGVTETIEAARERDLPCVIPWTFMLISEHVKKVIACPYHTRPYGDLEHNTLDEIWNGPIAREMRGSLLAGDVPLFCLNFSVACPVITQRKAEGHEGVVPDHIEVGKNDYWAFGSGWYGLEELPQAARWTSDRAEFKLRTAGKNHLGIRAGIDRPDIATSPVVGSLWCNGTRIGEFKLERNGWHDLVFAIPPRGDQVSDFAITIDRSWSPANEEESSDARKLGIAIQRIWTEDVRDRIEVGVNDQWFFRSGWHALERVPEMVRWTSGRSELTIRAEGKTRLHIRAMLNKSDVKSAPIAGEVRCDGQRLGAFTIKKHGWHELTFRFKSRPASSISSITISIDRPWSPADTVGNGDTRELGIAVNSVWAT